MTHNYVNEFHDSMNEHANARYKAVPPYVVEAERLGGADAIRPSEPRGFLRIWRRPSDDPRNSRWTKVYDSTGAWDEIVAEYDEITSESDVDDRAESWSDETKLP